jgi:hypothetical protein
MPPRNQKLTVYVPKSDVHTNAAFTEAEEFAFMLGEEVTVGVPSRSDWIESAQWDERSQILTLTTDRGATIPCDGIGELEARIFAQSSSKGVFYHAVVLGKGYEASFPSSTAGFGQKGVATPVAPKIVRKPAPTRQRKSGRSWWHIW